MGLPTPRVSPTEGRSSEFAPVATARCAANRAPPPPARPLQHPPQRLRAPARRAPSAPPPAPQASSAGTPPARQANPLTSRFDDHPASRHGEIGQPPPIAAMTPTRHCPAPRTGRVRHRGSRRDRHGLLVRIDLLHDHPPQMGEGRCQHVTDTRAENISNFMTLRARFTTSGS